MRNGTKPTRFIDSPAFRTFVGRYILGGYVRFAMATSRAAYHPPDYREKMLATLPVIYVLWHANMTAIGYMVPDYDNARVLVSPHPDGRMGAAAIATWGGKVIYGTGATERQRDGTRGVAGSLEALRALADGYSLLLTADVPPLRGRFVSRGIIRLARLSGRPLVPVAVGSSNRSILERVWDRMQVNHPFSKVAVVGGEPLVVDDGIDDASARALLKERLDAAYAEALALTRKPGRPPAA